MAVYQVDVQMSIPYAAGYAGRYYWTWVYYVLATNDTEAANRALSQTANQARSNTTTTVHYHGYQITSPPRSGIVTRAYTPLDLAGLRATGALLPLENVMKQRMYSGRALVGWRFWREGFLETDADGQVWTLTALARSQSKVDVMAEPGYVCSLHGAIIDSIVCDPRVAMRQLRHGTKRRARRVLT